ncbi:SSI family serine proteinase inhibitor [Streptomyces hypolithicus]
MRTPVTVTAVALLALASAALPARAADGTGGADRPEVTGGLFLTVSGSENAWVRGVSLHCAPKPLGPHPRAADACAALEKANGDLDKLAGDPHLCTREYDPVTVSVTGTWRGTATAWRKTYANACMLDSATGVVFGF